MQSKEQGKFWYVGLVRTEPGKGERLLALRTPRSEDLVDSRHEDRVWEQRRWSRHAMHGGHEEKGETMLNKQGQDV